VNPLSSLAGNLFSSLTGTDLSTLQAEATQAETIAIAAVEIIVLLMIIMMVQLAIIIRKL